MAVTITFSNEEFMVLVYHFVDGSVDTTERGSDLLVKKLEEQYKGTVAKKLRPEASRVWEALKGVVG